MNNAFDYFRLKLIWFIVNEQCVIKIQFVQTVKYSSHLLGHTDKVELFNK